MKRSCPSRTDRSVKLIHEKILVFCSKYCEEMKEPDNRRSRGVFNSFFLLTAGLK